MIQNSDNLTVDQKRVLKSMQSVLNVSNLPYTGKFTKGSKNIHYLEYGNPKNPVVILIHGMGGGGAAWFLQIPHLYKNYYVLVPDNPTFGLSYQPRIKKSFNQFVFEYILGFMDELKIPKASLIGVSLGGIAALGLAIQAPERVQKLALISTVGIGKKMPLGYRITSLYGLGRILLIPNKWVTKRVFDAWIKVKDFPARNQYIDYIHDTRVRKDNASVLYHNMRQFANFRGQKNIFTDEELSSIKAHTLILWGDKDTYFPVSHAMRLHSLVKNSHIDILPNAGHTLIWGETSITISEKILKFLSTKY